MRMLVSGIKRVGTPSPNILMTIHWSASSLTKDKVVVVIGGVYPIAHPRKGRGYEWNCDGHQDIMAAMRWHDVHMLLSQRRIPVQ